MGYSAGMRPAYTRIEARNIERRSAPRRRSLLAAKLSFAEAGLIADCGVRNISTSGALIELASTTLLQPPYRLLTMRDGVIYDAELVWTWGRLAGLQFTAEQRPEDEVTREARVLRSIWNTLRA